MDEQTRLLALAHLKNGKTPSETAELMHISYAAALKLKKELLAAEETNSIQSLFSLDKAALNILLESVTRQLSPAIEAFKVGELVDREVTELTKGINGAKLLSQDLQEAASELTKRITLTAAIASNSETLLTLADALCKLQMAFKGNELNSLPATSFEKHLSP